jgi:hypothetical protein
MRPLLEIKPAAASYRPRIIVDLKGQPSTAVLQWRVAQECSGANCTVLHGEGAEHGENHREECNIRVVGCGTDDDIVRLQQEQQQGNNHNGQPRRGVLAFPSQPAPSVADACSAANAAAIACICIGCLPPLPSSIIPVPHSSSLALHVPHAVLPPSPSRSRATFICAFPCDVSVIRRHVTAMSTNSIRGRFSISIYVPGQSLAEELQTIEAEAAASATASAAESGINFVAYDPSNVSDVTHAMAHSHVMVTSSCGTATRTRQGVPCLGEEFPNVFDAVAAGLAVFVSSPALTSKSHSVCRLFLRHKDTALFEDAEDGGLEGIYELYFKNPSLRTRLYRSHVQLHLHARRHAAQYALRAAVLQQPPPVVRLQLPSIRFCNTLSRCFSCGLGHTLRAFAPKCSYFAPCCAMASPFSSCNTARITRRYLEMFARMLF